MSIFSCEYFNVSFSKSSVCVDLLFWTEFSVNIVKVLFKRRHFGAFYLGVGGESVILRFVVATVAFVFFRFVKSRGSIYTPNTFWNSFERISYPFRKVCLFSRERARVLPKPWIPFFWHKESPISLAGIVVYRMRFDTQFSRLWNSSLHSNSWGSVSQPFSFVPLGGKMTMNTFFSMNYRLQHPFLHIRNDIRKRKDRLELSILNDPVYVTVFLDTFFVLKKVYNLLKWYDWLLQWQTLRITQGDHCCKDQFHSYSYPCLSSRRGYVWVGE